MRIVKHIKAWNRARVNKRRYRTLDLIGEAACPPLTFDHRQIGRRINLLIPAGSTHHIYGGMETGYRLFFEMLPSFDAGRIIITNEKGFSPEKNPALCEWLRSGGKEKQTREYFCLADDPRAPLSVAASDVFIATAWWTARIAREIQEYQLRAIGAKQPRKFIYLIQDYEPGFYPWSTRYALADSTYADSHLYVGVINSSLLRDFFYYHTPHRLNDHYVFEPTLHPELLRLLPQTKQGEKRILIYGRPGVARNAFEAILLGLRKWAAEFPTSDEWQPVSVGEHHPNYTLGNSRHLISLGKLSLENYSIELQRASVGISLMISPHPSYPPLEMAAYGIRTITNQYANKDLSALVPGIISVPDCAPQTLAYALSKATSNPKMETHLSDSNFWKNYLTPTSPFSQLIPQILQHV